MSDLLPLVLLVLAVFGAALGIRALFGRLRRPSPAQPRRPRRQPAYPDVEVRDNSILVDGSNVMFWMDNTPTPEALQRVLAALRNAGNDPILCFDANVGYKLVDQHLNRDELARFFGVAQRNILVCPSGTDADAMILRIAVDKSLPVVSNDRFRDYPDLSPRVRKMTGTIKGQKVELRLRENASGSRAERRQSQNAR